MNIPTWGNYTLAKGVSLFSLHHVGRVIVWRQWEIHFFGASLDWGALFYFNFKERGHKWKVLMSNF